MTPCEPESSRGVPVSRFFIGLRHSIAAVRCVNRRRVSRFRDAVPQKRIGTFWSFRIFYREGHFKDAAAACHLSSYHPAAGAY
jgi:hypothetical protein